MVGRAVQLDHRRVEAALIEVAADQGLAEVAVDVADRRQHALAEVALLVAVAQFEGLALAGRGARRHRGPPEGAVVEGDVDFHRRIARGNPGFPVRALLRFSCSNLDQEGWDPGADTSPESYHSRLPLTFDTAGVWSL